MTDELTALTVFGDKAVAAAKLARMLVAKLGPESADEDWVMAKAQMAEINTFAAELRRAFTEAFVERLKRGDIEVGEKRWYASKVNKTTRTVGAGDLLETLFEAVGGDFDEIKRCLSESKDTWKQSEVREVAPEVHAASFKTEPVYVQKEGKPVRKLKPALTR